jgi:hypothetical protein
MRLRGLAALACTSAAALGCGRAAATPRVAVEARAPVTSSTASSRQPTPAPVTPPAPTPWTDVAPGVRVRRANVVDEWRVLEWLVVRLDLTRVAPVATAVPDEDMLALEHDPTVLVAVDAGFFDDDHRPDGLLVSEGNQIAPVTTHGGSGLLCVRGGTADLFASTDTLPPGAPFQLAVQCGPRLVERDGAVGITRDTGARFARTAACVRDGGHTLDLVVTWLPSDPLRGPGLMALAQRLAQPSPVGDPRGCERALNLDGGPSTGVFVRGAPFATHRPVGPVPYALVVRSH